MRPHFLNESPLVSVMNAVAKLLTPERSDDIGSELPEKVEPAIQTPQSPSVHVLK